jgi:hypothetical protein
MGPEMGHFISFYSIFGMVPKGPAKLAPESRRKLAARFQPTSLSYIVNVDSDS